VRLKVAVPINAGVKNAELENTRSDRPVYKGRGCINNSHIITGSRPTIVWHGPPFVVERGSGAIGITQMYLSRTQCIVN